MPVKIQSAADRHLRRADPVLAPLIRRYGPCGMGKKKRDPFHVLATSIISQQLSVKAADTIQQRVEAALDCHGHFTPTILSNAAHETLRACGLSNAKASWLRALGSASLAGQLNFRKLARMSDEDAIATLDALPGVGRWTAEMFLMFAMGRPDIFSMGDVGLRNAVNKLYNRGRPLSDARTLKLAATWAPYRSAASWYLWRMTDGDNNNWT